MRNPLLFPVSESGRKPQQRGHRASFHRLNLPILAAASYLTLAPPILAQDDDVEEEEAAQMEQFTGEVEEVIVTGSRLRRSTYTSIAPLQIISADLQREAGLINAAEILQGTTVAAGQQVDLSFSGFVLDNGPGSQSVDLRGLGEARVLLLLNGKRLAPSGVGGAPFAPDLGLIPSSLIEQYDLLLDGASSIYGSDAVAGVGNIILRKSFDGLQIETFPNLPSDPGGDRNQFNVTWGREFDRGFVGVGAEYFDVEVATLDDRPWTAGCERHVEIDEVGQRRHQEQYWTTVIGMEWDDCTSTVEAGWISGVPIARSIWYTPGYSAGGWPNFSDWASNGIVVDGDGDGRTDISFRDYGLNGRQQFAYLVPDVRTINIMAYGEYTLEGAFNLTPFFEVLYAETDYFSNDGVSQLFPMVPALNPFNICNPEGQGVDCGLANDMLLTNPNFIAQFAEENAATCAANDIPPAACTPETFGRLTGPIGPSPVQPVVSVRGDRNTIDVDREYFRFVGGVSGDLPFLSVATLSDWSFELSITHSMSSGTSRQVGVRGDRLNLALGAYSTTNTPCENDRGVVLADDAALGCVPVNMFAASLYTGVIGDFETAAERYYLFGNRDFKTEYEQTIVSYYMTGNAFNLPAGPVSAGLGVEYRIDEIDSIPNAVAAEGLFFAFSRDGGAVGEKYIREAFGEIELPLLTPMRGAEELTLNLSGRWTDDEYYGSASTGSAKLAWRPVSSLLVRGTFGTSFRAPNLRELFLATQTGFGNVFDPCLIPLPAIDDDGGYLPDRDTRNQVVLENCRANGVDPTVIHNNGVNSRQAEIASGGSLTLDPETSESWTAGFSWEQPFTNEFDLSLGVTYYEIEVEDAIIEPGTQNIINLCYSSPTGSSVFCDRIQRESDSETPFIEFIDRGFINRDRETVRGVDLNLVFETTATVFERPIDLILDIQGHRLIERSTLFIAADGTPDMNQFATEWGFPERRITAQLRLEYDDWRFTWTTRMQSEQSEDPATVDDFNDVLNSEQTGRSGTCLGPPTDLLCRDVTFADSYEIHSVSLGYVRDTWRLYGGARNVFDEAPPQVNGDGPYNHINNTPIGYGFDLSGRTYFLNVSLSFGGGR